jgi:hypothetical protein
MNFAAAVSGEVDALDCIREEKQGCMDGAKAAMSQKLSQPAG